MARSFYKISASVLFESALGYEIESLHPSSLSTFSIRLTVSPSR